ncbi:hypothetical protein HanPSC8_Chr15g0687791 [Helianthus annuus]|nr:hypothetical protein HanPSC8_Chr15g0687791 [Helianthus annuus]
MRCRNVIFRMSLLVKPLIALPKFCRKNLQPCFVNGYRIHALQHPLHVLHPLKSNEAKKIASGISLLCDIRVLHYPMRLESLP